MDKESKTATASQAAPANKLWEQSRAKTIWAGLCALPECTEAWEFYRRKEMDLREDVLQRGSANFDEKHDANDQNEKPFYRALAYVKQYLSMHLRQNLIALHRHQSEIFTGTKSLLFVDFGCGPMTGGLALHDIARQTESNADMTYIGVDASKNMLTQADAINQTHRLFAPERFFLCHATNLVSCDIQRGWDTMILHLSFVLAEDTYKIEKNQQAAAQSLASSWKQWIETIRPHKMMLLYLNPDAPRYHANWSRLKSELGTQRTLPGYLSLSPLQGQEIWWHEDRDPCYSDLIHWRR